MTAVLDRPTAAAAPPREDETVVGLTTQELTDLLGPVPAWRVRHRPAPGTATFADAVECANRGELVELIEGVLLEKTVGFRESVLGVRISSEMKNRAEPDNLGLVAGADGPVELPEGQARMPDALFVSWEQAPGGFDHRVPIPDLPPTIAAEVVSGSNTRREMNRKLREYFEGGAKLVWYVYPRTRTVRVYTAAETFTTLSADAGDTLTAGDVLPGFKLPLAELFAVPQPPEAAAD